ncbi:uncharacterized protein LOC131937195 isoform X3 [Physella acuta]|nr:uncharacterized protein LOC131937195 isoform X3 [Physella acuta]
MALVTIQRSPSPSTDPELDADSTEDVSEGRSQLRKRSKTSREKLRKIFSTVRFISKLRPCLSESYFTVKGAALILPHNECTKKTTKKSHGGEIQSHLQAMLHLLRPEDSIKIAVRLEDVNSSSRYMALVSTRGRQDTEEAVILGIDCHGSEAAIGLVLPVWVGLRLKLGGDGGFSLCADEQHYLFKPVSVQAMWSAIQSLVKVMHVAEDKKYIDTGLTHTWVGYYNSRIDRRDATRLCQWNVVGIEVFAPSSLSLKSDDENENIKMTISQNLKDVMMSVDLDEATSIMLRKKVEEKMGISLAEFKSFFDEEVMRILGQMDEPSKILDYLYLGSEWNASNLEELKSKGISYILNVTKEIDNFFVGMFQYYNVRVCDVEEEELLKHWDKTYKFITKARTHNAKVLVHCKMGVSRSASTVMAYLMKEKRWSVEQAFDFVKKQRGCVQPNNGFMEQLRMYEGILTASNQRDIFRTKSDQNLLEENTVETSQGSFLGQSLFSMMSYSDWSNTVTSGGVAYKEEWSIPLKLDSALNLNMMQRDMDLEAAESRSADSIDECLPDVPSPPPSQETSSDFHPNYSGNPILVVTAPPCASSRAHFDLLSSDTETMDSDASSAQHSQSTGDKPSTSQTASIGAAGPRIKPDSSWIRLDSLDNPDEKDDINVKVISELQTDTEAQPSYGNTALNTNILNSDATGDVLVNADQSQTHLSSSVDPPFSNNCIQEFCDYSRNSKKCVHPLEEKLSPQISLSPVKENISCSTVVSPNLRETHPPSVSQVGGIEISRPGHEKMVDRFDDPEVSPDVDGDLKSKDETTPTKQSKAGATKIDIGVRQYFYREKIPWHPGKVKRIREDINKTGQIVTDDDDDDDTDNAFKPKQLPYKEMSEDRSLLDSLAQPPSQLALSQSHSCIELCTLGEAGHMTLYEKEEIPLEPGTVWRSRREIEERQRLFSGDGVEEIFLSTRPVLRSLSLKQERDSPRYRLPENRRSLMSAVVGKSLDDLRSVDVSDVGLTVRQQGSYGREAGDLKKYKPVADVPMVTSSDDDTPITPGLVLKQTKELESRFDHVQSQGGNSDTTSPWTSGQAVSSTPLLTSPPHKLAHFSDYHEPCEENVAQGISHRRSNFDSETLALIREIGSALLMSPSGSKSKLSDEEEPCTNMVKYFVRKIEKQNISQPKHDNTLTDDDSKVENENRGRQSMGYDEVDCGHLSPLAPVRTTKTTSLTLDFSSPARNVLSSPRQERRYGSWRSLDQTSSQSFHQASPSDAGCEGNHSGEASAFLTHVPAAVVVGGLGSATRWDEGGVSAQSSSASSPRSPTHHSSDSAEPSVVRHLVGKFEIKTPDMERSVTSEFGHDYIYKGRDHYDNSPSTSPTTPLKVTPKQDIISTPSFNTQPTLPSSLPSTSVLKLIDNSPVLSSTVSTSSCTLSSLHRKHTSLDSAQPPPQAKGYSDIAVELYELPTISQNIALAQTKEKKPVSGLFPSSSASKPGPTPFSRSSMEGGDSKPWRSVRPKSADVVQTADVSLAYQNVTDKNGDRKPVLMDTSEDEAALRQVSEEGRKIRRLHGKSHPLTKLSDTRTGKGPFHSSM